jgi:hypothetical protein
MDGFPFKREASFAARVVAAERLALHVRVGFMRIRVLAAALGFNTRASWLAPIAYLDSDTILMDQ